MGPMYRRTIDDPESLLSAPSPEIAVDVTNPTVISDCPGAGWLCGGPPTGAPMGENDPNFCEHYARSHNRKFGPREARGEAFGTPGSLGVGPNLESASARRTAARGRAPVLGERRRLWLDRRNAVQSRHGGIASAPTAWVVWALDCHQTFCVVYISAGRNSARGHYQSCQWR